MRWGKVTLIGVGLLGGSLGQALKTRGLAGHVTGYVRREQTIRECLQAGAVDSATLDLEEGVQGADLVVLCTPLAQMGPLIRRCAPALAPGALVTDVGSVKGDLVRDLEPVVSKTGAYFVGSHPMAGSEKTGVLAARPDLFVNAVVVTTPTSLTPSDQTNRAADLWRSVGARVLSMNADEHDRLVSRSSHLPHLLAAHLAQFVLHPNQPSGQSKLCATGFKDSTRIASGSPEMWRDIIISNRKEIARSLNEFAGQLSEFSAVLERNDPAEIENFLREAKTLRDSWLAACPSPSQE